MTKISLATSAFNIVKNNFDICDAIKNWKIYVDEIVIGTIPSEDNTEELLNQLGGMYDIPIKIVKIDDSTEKPGWDGRIKNAAHQASSHEIVAQVDLDERMSGKPELWRDLAGKLLENDPQIKSLLIPSINLWSSFYLYSDIGAKWYLSVKDGTHRGIVNFAKTLNGFDRNRSDSTEILIEGDNLAPSINFTQYTNFTDALEYCKSDMPFVWHLGALDLSRRAKINKEFWKDCWDKYDEGESDVVTSEKELEKKETFEHGIEIDFL